MMANMAANTMAHLLGNINIYQNLMAAVMANMMAKLWVVFCPSSGTKRQSKAAAMQEANAADAPYKALDSAVDAYSAAVRARQKAEEEEAAAEAAVYQALEMVERGA